MLRVLHMPSQMVDEPCLCHADFHFGIWLLFADLCTAVDSHFSALVVFVLSWCQLLHRLLDGPHHLSDILVGKMKTFVYHVLGVPLHATPSIIIALVAWLWRSYQWPSGCSFLLLPCRHKRVVGSAGGGLVTHGSTDAFPDG